MGIRTIFSNWRLNIEDIGRIKALKEEWYSNRDVAERIDPSSRVITATMLRRKRSILREGFNSTSTTRNRLNYSQCYISTKRNKNIWNVVNCKRPFYQLTTRRINRILLGTMSIGMRNVETSFLYKKKCFDGSDGYTYYFRDLRKKAGFGVVIIIENMLGCSLVCRNTCIRNF